MIHWHQFRIRRCATILMMAGLIMVGMLILTCLPAAACYRGVSCDAEDIDSFFLPLIAASLLKDTRIIASHLMPNVTSNGNFPDGLWPDSKQSTPLPEDLAIIRPETVAAPPVADRPALLLELELTSGDLAAGGSTQLFVDLLESATTKPAVPRADSAGKGGLPPLRRADAHSSLWQLSHIDELPAVPSWPLDRLALPLDMRLACGACGPQHRFHSFQGTANLEMIFDGTATGWIDDINLVSESGLRASGALTFTDQQTDSQIIEDSLARMTLRIGDHDTVLQGSLFAWMTAMETVNGAFSMVPVDQWHAMGAFAGHFSGTSCVDDCGVEN